VAAVGEAELARAWLLLAFSLLWSDRASAQFTLVMQIDSDPAGIALSGSGTSATSLDFVTVRAFGGAVPSGVTKAVGASSWTLSTTIDVQVFKGALDVLDALSTSYTLTASLQAADAVNTWKFNSFTLSPAGGTITSTGVYNSTPAYSFSLTIPFSASPGIINNTVHLTAIAN
jgi:hypothetical protein